MKRMFISTSFIVAQCIDCVFTYILISYFGFQEHNPVAHGLFQQLGMLETITLKLVIALGLVSIYMYMNKSRRIFAGIEYGLIVGSIMSWGVVGINTMGFI